MADNSQYIVSARKYRPATFRSVVGQRSLTTTLKNAITSGRIAQAYLFCGPRGVGKTSCARIFARTINCTNPTADGEACGECDSCVAITKGTSYNLIELDAASNNSVDDIRALIEQVNIPPQMGQYKVFIIDEVHMLSSQAFNAFLKTLEEPPKYAVFILATTEKHKVIPTILSRCQIYDFKRITIDDTIEHLEYVAQDLGVTADRRALGVIARKADGAMRDALSIFDQVVASSQGNLTYESAVDNLNVLDYDYYFRLVDSFAEGDIPGALLIYKEIRDKGFDSLFFVNGLASHIRDLMAAADSRTLPLLEVDAEMAEAMKAQTAKLPLQWYYAAMKILNDCDYNYRTSSNKQLFVEVALIRLCQLLKPATPPFDLAEELPPLRSIMDGIKDRDYSQVIGSVPPVVSDVSNKDYEVANGGGADNGIAETHSAESLNSLVGKTRQDVADNVRRVPEGFGRSPRPSAFRLSELNEEPLASEMPLALNQYSVEEFESVWMKFIVSHSETMHLLSGAMKACERRIIQPELVEIKVSHPAHLKAFEHSLSDLSEYLRKELGNDKIHLSVAIDESEIASQRLSPAEFLKKVVAENSVLGDFLNDIEAEITR